LHSCKKEVSGFQVERSWPTVSHSTKQYTFWRAADMEETTSFGTTADVDNLDVLQALSAKALKVTLIEQQQTKIALRVSP
jgi:hypothetical protein